MSTDNFHLELRNGILHYVASDGFSVPAVMGAEGEGDPPSVQQQVQDAISAPEVDEQTGEEGSSQTQDSDGQGSEDYSLANGFLENVPEQHREVVAPYVRQWDAGVTRKFQDLHQKYAPYEQLLGGYEEPQETLEQAVQVYTLMSENPELVYRLLHQQYGGGTTQESPQQQVSSQPQQSQQQSTQQQTPGNVPEWFSTYQQEAEQRLAQQSEILESLAQIVLGNQRLTQEQQQDQQLDEYLGLLKTESGLPDQLWDEEFVLSKMERGVSGEDAVKQLKQFHQKAVEQFQATSNQAPRVLSGAGSAPGVRQPQLGQMGSKDVTALVADIIKQSNQE